mmetsp:Transcript_20605/g.41238  ORF Transcript_20605/g.41238 Transcript_20605/m.41238 type:complete len:733 (+) Transcript_20605:178-2376(+)
MMRKSLLAPPGSGGSSARDRSPSKRSPLRRSPVPSGGAVAGTRMDGTRARVERIEAEREARRVAMANLKIERAEEEQRNLAEGNPGDIDFIGLVRQWRSDSAPLAHPHASPSRGKICICVRKRPVFDRERLARDHDSVTVCNPAVHVHTCRLRVDGITKYMDHNGFAFDHSFGEEDSTGDVYRHTTQPLVEFVLSGRGGRATCFAYGQTGSGKTHTMGGIQEMVAEDIYAMLAAADSGGGRECRDADTTVTVSFYELYGGRCQDLLNNRNGLKILEDGNGEVVVTGLEEFEAGDPYELMELVERGNSLRTTHATEKNDTSSRSHAVCQITLRDKSNGRLKGKLSLVDLAGSERGSDTKSHNRQRRTESAEINKSLLALKECIRALDNGKGQSHVPYRSSKLTLVLKDCFTSPLARTTMIATVSPGASSCDHTINTLRYADRVKEKKVGEISSAAVLEEKAEKNAYLTRDKNNGKHSERNDDRKKSSKSPSEFSRFKVRSRSPGMRPTSNRSMSPHVDLQKARHNQSSARSPLRTKSCNRSPAPSRKITASGRRSPWKNDCNSCSPPRIGRSSPALQHSPNVTTRPSPLPRTEWGTSTISEPIVSASAKKQERLDIQEARSKVDLSQLFAENERPPKEETEFHDNTWEETEVSKDNYFEDEESLLNLHMNIIQESAELLTEEGHLLQNVQANANGTNDWDIDEYATRLEKILEKKFLSLNHLQDKLTSFRNKL